MKYSPQLDGLRALCIIFTIFNHVEGHPNWINGSVGVDVFFALSGFLITKIIYESDKTFFALKSFYVRRLFRIAPIYYFSFVLTSVAALAMAYGTGDKAKLKELEACWMYIVLFLGEYRPKEAGSFFGHSWTIGIEEKFYIIWPIVFFFLVKNSLSQVFLLLVSIVIFGLIGGLEFRGYGGITLGCLAAILASHWKIKFSNPLVGLLALVISYIFVINEHGSNIIISLSAAIFIPSLFHDEKSLISKFFALRLFSWLGKLTFSIYMLHILCINVVKIFLQRFEIDNWFMLFVIGYLLSVLVAWCSYRLIELPLIKYGKYVSERRNFSSDANLY